MKNVKKYLVKRPVAEAAKALGYDLKSSWYYHDKESETYKKHKRFRGLSFSKYNQVSNTGSSTIVVPLQDMLRDWLWDTYKVSVAVNLYEDGFGYLVKHSQGYHIVVTVDYTFLREFSDKEGVKKHETAIDAMEEGLLAGITYVNKRILPLKEKI